MSHNPMDADQSQQFTPTVVSTDTFHIENTILRGRVAELESQVKFMNEQKHHDLRLIHASGEIVAEWKESYEKKSEELEQLMEKFRALVIDRAEANRCVVDMEKRLSEAMKSYATFYESIELLEGEDEAKIKGLKARILVHDENNAQLNQQVQARNKRIDVLEGTLSQLTERNGNLADSVEHHKKALAAVRLRLESVSKADGPGLNAGSYGIEDVKDEQEDVELDFFIANGSPVETEDVLAILSKCVEADKSTGGNVFVRFSSNGSVCVQAAAVPEASCPDESPAEAIAHLGRLIAMGREPCVSVPVPLEYLKRLVARQSISYLHLSQFEANCAAALLEATGNQQESGQ